MRILGRIFARRPRILNLLHHAHIVGPISQTNETELRTIEKYAQATRLAFEIGSFQGVSAVRIAASMAKDGILYCVDPWPTDKSGTNPCYLIFKRHVRRMGVSDKVRILRVRSKDALGIVPDQADFAFVDGDHSWGGIEVDWRLVRQKVRVGGVVCLHDCLIPPTEPWRQPDSVRFYRDVICADTEFQTIDEVNTLAVLRRIQGD